MTKEELYQAILTRMKNFNISFDEAVKEIKEIYPKYADILDEMTDPNKTKIEMSFELWEAIERLMYFVGQREFTEEGTQRQLGVVEFLYRKEFY